MEITERDIDAALISAGPTSAEELANTFEKHYGISVKETYDMIDKFVDHGFAYMDDDGDVYLLPDHKQLLIDHGKY